MILGFLFDCLFVYLFVLKPVENLWNYMARICEKPQLFVNQNPFTVQQTNHMFKQSCMHWRK